MPKLKKNCVRCLMRRARRRRVRGRRIRGRNRAFSRRIGYRW